MRKLVLAALLASTGAHAQTFTQMEWGVDKTATPYNIATKVGGSWRSIGTLTSGGSFLPAFYVNSAYSIPFVSNRVGTGPSYTYVQQTSGSYGTYGLDLLDYDAATSFTPAAGEGVFARTSWVTASNLVSSNSVFAGWWGANSPSQKLGHTWTASANNQVSGGEINFGNRWADFGILTDLSCARCVVGLQIVPDPVPTAQAIPSWAVSNISIGASAVVTVTAHNFTQGMGVVFSGSGLPIGITAGTTYYVGGTINANDFQLTATPGTLSLVTTSGTFSGTNTVLPSYPGSIGVAVAHSIHGHQIGTGYLNRYDTIQKDGYGMILGGNLTGATNQPFEAIKLLGYWSNGIDTSAATLTTHALVMHDGQKVSWDGGANMQGSGTNLVLSGSITAATYAKVTPTTFASGLGGSSTCSDKGRIWAVTDGAGALAWGANISGGGSTYYTINCNGSNWTVAGK